MLKRSQIAENINDKILKSNLSTEDKFDVMDPAPVLCRYGNGIAVKPDIDPVVKDAVLKTITTFKPGFNKELVFLIKVINSDWKGGDIWHEHLRKN